MRTNQLPQRDSLAVLSPNAVKLQDHVLPNLQVQQLVVQLVMRHYQVVSPWWAMR